MGAVKRASEISIWLHRLDQKDEHKNRYAAVGGCINKTIDAVSGNKLHSFNALENRRIALLRQAILNKGKMTVSGRSALSEYHYLWSNRA